MYQWLWSIATNIYLNIHRKWLMWSIVTLMYFIRTILEMQVTTPILAHINHHNIDYYLEWVLIVSASPPLLQNARPSLFRMGVDCLFSSLPLFQNARLSLDCPPSAWECLVVAFLLMAACVRCPRYLLIAVAFEPQMSIRQITKYKDKRC